MTYLRFVLYWIVRDRKKRLIVGGLIQSLPTSTRLILSDYGTGFQCLNPTVTNHCRPRYSVLITGGWKYRFVRNGWMKLQKRDLRLTGNTKGERPTRPSKSG